MPEQTTTQIIKPDLNFVKEVIVSGGGDLKKCYQCSTCTVVCNVTPDDKPFPRKEMVHAQWGLKDKLISNPDIWLCHQCSDCTAYCPRGAKPGEVIGAIRKMAIKNYSVPSVLANMVADPKYIFVLFAIPVIILLGITASLGTLFEVPRVDGKIVYSKFMPIIFIDIVYVLAAAFAVGAFAMGIRKYWKDMSGGMKFQGNLFSSIKETILEILAHKRFQKCNVAKDRKIAHLLVFYSFIGLAITTTLAIIYIYGFNYKSPYPLYDPLKIIGNISGVALLIGIGLVASNRIKNAAKAGLGSYFDWLFIVVVAVIAVTGMGAQFLRLADIGFLAYPTYFLHLVFVFFLFAYAPFSKMAHMIYRTTAMVFARHSGRDTMA
jgi:quinone-modifying oxidoreductase subunit QmoC